MAVSGVEFDRSMRTLIRGSNGIRTIIFPDMLRTIRQAAFSHVKSLRKAALNEGLKVLGTDETAPNGRLYLGVFCSSGLRSVVLPSTLKKIWSYAFAYCADLKTVRFPEGLEYLGVGCFYKTGLESAEFPASIRTISQASFSECENLNAVRFAEGLEVLGTD